MPPIAPESLSKGAGLMGLFLAYGNILFTVPHLSLFG